MSGLLLRGPLGARAALLGGTAAAVYGQDGLGAPGVPRSPAP